MLLLLFHRSFCSCCCVAVGVGTPCRRGKLPAHLFRSLSIFPTMASSSSLPSYLSSDDIDRKLAENERMLEEWRQLFIQAEGKTGAIMTAHEMHQHSQLRRKINENLALLASQLKLFFAAKVYRCTSSCSICEWTLNRRKLRVKGKHKKHRVVSGRRKEELLLQEGSPRTPRPRYLTMDPRRLRTKRYERIEKGIGCER